MYRLPAAAVAVAAALLAGCGSGAGSGGDAAAPPAPPNQASAADAHFVAGMIPHHETAVEMGEIARDRAEHQELRGLAEDIVRVQTDEIRELRTLSRDLSSARGAPPRGMGMMGSRDPEELRRADPFDRAFIDEMVPHHEMAIRMATMVSRVGRDPRVRDLAERIVVGQQREIEQMIRWRERWYGAPAQSGGMGMGSGGMDRDRMGRGAGAPDGMGPPAR